MSTKHEFALFLIFAAFRLAMCVVDLLLCESGLPINGIRYILTLNAFYGFGILMSTLGYWIPNYQWHDAKIQRAVSGLVLILCYLLRFINIYLMLVIYSGNVPSELLYYDIVDLISSVIGLPLVRTNSGPEGVGNIKDAVPRLNHFTSSIGRIVAVISVKIKL